MTAILDQHRETLASDPENTKAFEALQEHLFLDGQWDELVSLYRQRLEAPSLQEEPRRRAPILFRLGQILEERCSEIDQAAAIYWDAVKVDPTFRPALRQLRQIHCGRAQWDMVLQIAEIEDQLEMSAAERATFLAEMGHIWLAHLDDCEEAKSCFERARAADPQEKRALEGLALTHQMRGDWAVAAETWEELVGLLRGPERAPALVALGRLYSGPLEQGERATQCFRRAMTDDARNADAVESLIEIARAQEQWNLLADLYERRFDLSSGARQRSAVAVEAGYIQLEQLNDIELARSWFARGLELVADDASVHQAMAEVARRQGDTAVLKASLERVVELSGDAAPVSTLLEAADLCSDEGNDSQALAHLQQAQASNAADPLVIEALSDALARAGRSGELAEVLEQRASLFDDDPEMQAEALYELGQVYEDDLADREAAINALARAFAANPQMHDATRRLQHLYRQTERWGELRDLLERASAEAPPERRASYCCALGEVLLDHHEDFEAATSAFESTLELDPTSAKALRGLERIARESGDEQAMVLVCEREASATTDPARLGELVDELVRLLEGHHEPERALVWIERLLEATPEDRQTLETAARLQREIGRLEDLTQTLQRLDPLLLGTEQAANRLQLAQLASESGDEAQAIASLESAAESDPTNCEIWRELKRRYEAGHQLHDVARVQRRLADTLPADEQARCLDELTTLLETQLGDMEAAIVVLWRLCDMPARPAGAPERLEALLERAGRFEELAQRLLERRRAVPDDSDDAEEIDLRRAHLLLDQLGQAEQAASLFRSIRDRNPGCQEATTGLEQALRSGNDSAGLALLLESRARNEEDASARAHIEFERAVILEEALEDEENAQSLYTALADQMDDASIGTLAAARLVCLLERRGDWATLRRRLEDNLRGGPGEDDLQLHERLAVICRDRLADREGGIEHLESIGRLQPENAETWRQLAQLYDELERPEDLLHALEAELDCQPDIRRELILRSKAADLCSKLATAEDSADSKLLVRARGHYERVLELDAGHSRASEFLIDHYESEGRLTEVARLLRGRLDARRDEDERDPDQRVSLQLRVADLLADRLDDVDGAIGTLEEALAEIGPVGLVSEPLAELYARAGAVDELVDLCRRASGRCDAAEEKAGWMLRLGSVLREAGETGEAVEAYCAALVDCPGDREIEAVLRDLYRELGDAQSLASLLEGEIPRLSALEQVPLRIELAELLREQLARPEDALAQLQKVLSVEPERSVAFDAAVELSEQLGLQEEILRLIEARLASGGDLASATGLLERRGDLLAGALERPEEAASAYREAIALDPDNGRARRSLCSVLQKLERWPAVLDCLHLESHACTEEERVPILERAAEIARQHVSSDAQLPWLQRLRAERPDDADVVARMADVHRQAGRPEALLRALELELSLVSDPEQTHDLQLQRARVLERDLQSPARAITAYEIARTVAPNGAAPVLRELDRLYKLAGRAHRRVDVLEALLELAAPEERIGLHREAATILSTSFAEPDRAAAHLVSAVSLCEATAAEDDELFPILLRELQENLRAAGQTDAWVRAAEAEFTWLTTRTAADRPRCADLHWELANTYARDLGLPDEATGHLRALLALVEQAEQTGEEGLSPERLERAELELIGRLRASGNLVALGGQLEKRLARDRGDSEEWLELAQLRTESLHAPAAAAQAYREVLARQPSCLAAIRGLRHVCECLRDWSEVARSIELELALPNRWAARELLALQKRLGDICRQRLQAPERAIEAYRAALEASPGDLDALRSLEQLVEQCEDWSEALDLFELEVDILGEDDPDRRHWLWLQNGRIACEHTDDPQRALRGFEAAARISRLSAPDQLTLASLYRAVDDVERFSEAFAHWCDDPESGASCRDHLAVVGALEELGRSDAALERALTATRLADGNAESWETLARLYEQRADLSGASEALQRAADLRDPKEAALLLVRAAELSEGADAEAAAQLLRRATQRDPGLARAHAELARVAERLEQLDVAEEAAGLALELASAGDQLDGERQLASALVGGRTARAQQRLEQAARFYAAALELDPDHREAMDAQGEIVFELGEYDAARKLLQARLEMHGSNSRRAWQLAAVARCLEHESDNSTALARYQEALEIDPSLSMAHEGSVRIHEQAGRDDLAVSALESWICQDEDRGSRARSHLQAAEHLLNNGDLEASEAHLRKALSEDADLQRTWVLLSELLLDLDRTEEALSTGDLALEHVTERELRARVSLIRGRVLDQREEVRKAAEAYGDAARGDARCAEAALAEARLLRSMGDWYAAAEALERFASAHPEPDSLELAQIHLERGRLMSGPLENVQQAICCYERALELRPGLSQARKPLATLLAHVPGRWEDAVCHHQDLLGDNPTRQSSLRALLEISRRRDLEKSSSLGLAVLRALGIASPEEVAYSPDSLPVQLRATPPLEEPTWETVRQICKIAAQEIGEVLAETSPPARAGDQAMQDFWAHVGEAEASLTAPGLCWLPSEQLSSIVYTLTALSADPGGNCNDGPYLHSLDGSLGRWTRRKIRKSLEDTAIRDVQAIDYQRWREQIRLLAACKALDTTGGDLRTALIALASEEQGEDWAGPSESADITALVAGSDLALQLLGRAVDAWCREISRGA